ncbi:hypothetical protein MUK42_04295 [Musa troglodytarum]|uniref:Uncharacterized protein n=1 Tax=Musa troglodytarum TaxID=320322 RepID=A0A9E7I6E8_9LILI|nr:hypothetical protein MUK42_04295 [Musa troglodytarum]
MQGYILEYMFFDLSRRPRQQQSASTMALNVNQRNTESSGKEPLASHPILHVFQSTRYTNVQDQNAVIVTEVEPVVGALAIQKSLKSDGQLPVLQQQALPEGRGLIRRRLMRGRRALAIYCHLT